MTPNQDGFAQVSYVEYDQVPDPQYVTLSVIGWVPETALVDRCRRHFYHLELNEPTEERWTVRADNHEFLLFWAPLSALPEIISPQDEWLAILRAYLLIIAAIAGALALREATFLIRRARVVPSHNLPKPVSCLAGGLLERLFSGTA